MEKIAWGSAICLVAMLALFPDFSSDHLVLGNDLAFHLNRIEGLKEGLLAGQFPVRINPVQLGGYGMPSSIFYPDTFLYIPAILRLLGVSLAASWNAFLLASSLMTAASSWWAFSAYTRSLRTGAIATLFYLASLYRLIAMYLTAGAGMLLGMAFFPAAVLSVWLTLHRKSSYWPSAVFFTTCLLQSHILTSILYLLFVLIMVVISCKRFFVKDVRRAACKASGFIFFLNLWFYAPLLYFYQHMDYVMKSTTRDGIQIVTFPLLEVGGYMGSGMLAILIILVVAAACRRWKPPFQFWELLLLSAGFLWLMSSSTPWEGWLGQVFSFLQFPVRFVVFPTMFLSLAMAIGLSHLRRSWGIFLCVLLCLGGNFLWLFGSPYAVPQNTLVAARTGSAKDLQLVTAVGTGARDYMDRSVSEQLPTDDDMQRKVADTAIHPDDRIVDVRRQGTDFVIQYAVGGEEQIQLPLFWYTGYAAEIAEGTGNVFVRKDADGQVSISLPSSAGTVHVWYRGLPWFRILDRTSCLALLFFLYAGWREKNRKERN